MVGVGSVIRHFGPTHLRRMTHSGSSAISEQRAIRPHPRHAGRQDRAEPSDERDAGGDGAGPVPVLVRRFRPRAGEDGRLRHRAAEGDRRPVPRAAGGLGAGGDTGRMATRIARCRGSLPESGRAASEVPAFGRTLQRPVARCQDRPTPSFRRGEQRRVGRAPAPSRSASSRTATVRRGCSTWSGSAVGPYVAAGDWFAALNLASLQGAFREVSQVVLLTALYLGALPRVYAGLPRTKRRQSGHIKRHHLTDAVCVVPPNRLIIRVSGLLGGLLERGVANEVASRTLVSLRDALLPKLVSGELRVNGLEPASGSVDTPTRGRDAPSLTERRP